MYFSIGDLDLGRIDGHQCMPALRWEECKQIANYQRIELPFTYDHIILLLSLLTFPDESNLEDYCQVTSTAIRKP